MPLLVLCDPGFAASVGVSKPAGASVAGGCAIAGHAAASTPSSNTRAEWHVRVIVSSSERWVCSKRVSRRQEGARSRQLLASLPPPPRFGWVRPRERRRGGRLITAVEAAETARGPRSRQAGNRQHVERPSVTGSTRRSPGRLARYS